MFIFESVEQLKSSEFGKILHKNNLVIDKTNKTFSIITYKKNNVEKYISSIAFTYTFNLNEFLVELKTYNNIKNKHYQTLISLISSYLRKIKIKKLLNETSNTI